MAERLDVIPEELRKAADEHRHTADQLAAVPAGHAAIMATLDSLGPIFAEFREAGRELLEQRRICYEQQAGAHAELSGHLLDAAGRWEQHEADAAGRLRDVAEGGR